MSEQEKCPILAGILNPQPNPQNAAYSGEGDQDSDLIVISVPGLM
jgi:hypothetical protein